MSSLQYVDLETARAAPGTRIVTSALVPSPWSEAAKGIFSLASLPAMVVGTGRDRAEVVKWTGIDNVPVLVHDDEPVRTSSSAIVGLAARLAGPDVVVPADPAERAEMMGLLDLIAGENGLGWNARLAMIDASLSSGGKRGFALPIGQYLAKRYGHDPASLAAGSVRELAARQLRLLDDRLAAQEQQGLEYFSGARPLALDVFSATFLTPLMVIDDAVCPQMLAPFRAAFAPACELLGDLVTSRLLAHRTMMFTRHLTLPIRLA